MDNPEKFLGNSKRYNEGIRTESGSCKESEELEGEIERDNLLWPLPVSIIR